MAEGYRFSALIMLVRLPLRTLLHTFDFAGRSTRTEVLFWVLVAQAAVGLAVFSLPWDFGVPHDVSRNAFTLLFFIPAVALIARRLNDQERTRWWLLLLPLGLVDEVMGLFPMATDVPEWIFGAANLLALVGLIAVLFLESGTPGPNRFGDDPRTSLAYS